MAVQWSSTDQCPILTRFPPAACFFPVMALFFFTFAVRIFFPPPPASEFCLLAFVLCCDWFAYSPAVPRVIPPYSVTEDRSQEENKENGGATLARGVWFIPFSLFSPLSMSTAWVRFVVCPPLFYFIFFPFSYHRPSPIFRSACLPLFNRGKRPSRLQYPSRLGSQCPRDALELARRPPAPRRQI